MWDDDTTTRKARRRFLLQIVPLVHFILLTTGEVMFDLMTRSRVKGID